MLSTRPRLGRKLPLCVLGLLALTVTPTPSAAAEAAGPLDGPLEGLHYRAIGPAVGGRVSRAVGVPGDPLTYWAATAAGGVWKSEDGGFTFEPVFDDQPVSSIGVVAVSPSNPEIVWVGTGEANIRGNVAEGNGIYRSPDGGETWENVWQAEGQIGSLAVHPTDPDTVWAAVLGSPFGPSETRGVFRTADGGRTWARVLFRDSATGASDVALHPANPRTLLAGLWQTRRTPWSLTSGGPGSGLFRSTDGGQTWTELSGSELPEKPWGRVGVRFAPSDPERVYALIEAEEGGLFRSDDGGANWERINDSRALRQRAWYYTTLTVDPTDADTVWFPQVPMLKTVDGGRTVDNVRGGGWDYHDLWIDPADPGRMIVASDAGVSLSLDGGATWRRPPMAIGQLYHLTTDLSRPYRVLGSFQDRGTLSGPSDSLRSDGILASDWHSVGGGEAGWVVPDPSDPGAVWAGEYLGFLSRWDDATGRAPNLGIYPENGSGRGAGQLEVRFQWTAPILVSRHDPSTVYHAGDRLFRTRDAGETWTAVSPDLSRDDESKQDWSGGPITGDNTGVEYYGTIFALAESPVAEGLLWAGTDDGRVHVTQDGGGAWREVTPTDLPEWATVSHLEPSPFARDTAWLVADAHRLDDETPYLWRTTDLGRTWKRLGAELDQEVTLHVVREDPEVAGLLYLGTERGVALSRDAGDTWESLSLDLPTVAVVDLAIADDDLVVATLGRSIWILDDLTPVRQWRPEIVDATGHLFPPRPAVAWFERAALPVREGAMDNPPRGVHLTYWLADEPTGELRLEVLDAAGKRVRTLSSEPPPAHLPEGHPDLSPDWTGEPDLPAKLGLQRTTWDLRWDGAELPSGTPIDIGSPEDGPSALPGEYLLRLTDGETTSEQPVTVLPDPRSEVRREDREAQLEHLLAIRDSMTEIARRVETIRAIRRQIDVRRSLVESRHDAGEWILALDDLAVALDEIEGRLHNPRAEVSYDILAGRHGGAQLYSRYSWLFEAGRDHPGPPTQGMTEVRTTLDGELAALATAFGERVLPAVRALNDRAREADAEWIEVPQQRPATGAPRQPVTRGDET